MPDDITVREAREADVPTLVRFLVKLDAHVSGIDPEVLELTREGERQIAERLHDFLGNRWKLLLVAERGGEVVAMGDVALRYYTDLWRNPERRHMASAFIDDLWVEPGCRQSGVGKAILERLLEFTAAHDVHDLVLEYSITNEEASAAWQRLGFRPAGVRATASVSEVRRRLHGGGTPSP